MLLRGDFSDDRIRAKQFEISAGFSGTDDKSDYQGKFSA